MLIGRHFPLKPAWVDKRPFVICFQTTRGYTISLTYRLCLEKETLGIRLNFLITISAGQLPRQWELSLGIGAWLFTSQHVNGNRSHSRSWSGCTLVCNRTATKVPTQHQESGSPPAEPITAYYPTIQSRQYKKATIISEKLTL